MEMFTIKKQVWTHPSPKNRTDYQGQIRFVLYDEDGVCWNHYASEDEAQEDVPLDADWTFEDCTKEGN